MLASLGEQLALATLTGLTTPRTIFKCTAIPAQISDCSTSAYLIPHIFREISLARSVFCVYLYLSSSRFQIKKLIEIAEATGVIRNMYHAVLLPPIALDLRAMRNLTLRCYRAPLQDLECYLHHVCLSLLPHLRQFTPTLDIIFAFVNIGAEFVHKFLLTLFFLRLTW